jgi:hypothetical protein
VDPEELIGTINALAHRISERFPGAGLAALCTELEEVTKLAADRAEKMKRPVRSVRYSVWLIVLSCLAAGLYVLSMRTSAGDTLNVIQALLAIVGVIFTSLLFFPPLEERVLRNRALTELRKLHALLGAVDLHQLTKDPSVMPGSRPRGMSSFEVLRYIDYCSEAQSLIGKAGVLFAQALNDPAVVGAVIELEQLAASQTLSVRLKIMMIMQLETAERTA